MLNLKPMLELHVTRKWIIRHELSQLLRVEQGNSSLPFFIFHSMQNNFPSIAWAVSMERKCQNTHTIAETTTTTASLEVAMNKKTHEDNKRINSMWKYYIAYSSRQKLALIFPIVHKQENKLNVKIFYSIYSSWRKLSLILPIVHMIIYIQFLKSMGLKFFK